MKVIFLVILSLLCIQAIARPDRPRLNCSPYGNGWQVFNGNIPLGSGHYDRRACNEALYAARNGFVCAAQNGGAIIVDTRSNLSAGTGRYTALNGCIEAVNASTRSGLVCGAENGGTVLYSRRAGVKLGTGKFQNIQTCVEAAQGTANRLACGAQNGGAAMFTLEGRQLGQGTWATIADCTAATHVVRNGLVCVPESGVVKITNIYTGITGGRYYNVADCQRDL